MERTVSPNEGAALFKAFVDKRQAFLASEAEAKLAYSRLAKEQIPGVNAYEKLAKAKAAISDRFQVSPDRQAKHLWNERLVWLKAVIEVKPAKPAQKPRGKTKRIKVNDRMATELLKNPESRDWSAQQWADKLGCRKSTVAGTLQWKALLAARVGAHLERQVRRARFTRQ